MAISELYLYRVQVCYAHDYETHHVASTWYMCSFRWQQTAPLYTVHCASPDVMSFFLMAVDVSELIT